MVARRLARRVRTHHSRAMGIGDSRAALGGAAKGRPGSHKINRELRKFLPDLLGGNIWLCTFWVESARNPADAPSRGKPLDPPKVAAGRLAEFISGAAPLLNKEEVRAWNAGKWRPQPLAPLNRQVVRFAKE